MANLTIMRARFPVATNGAGYANLVTPDPKEVASHTTGLDLELDFGESISADTFFLGFLTGDIASGATIRTATGYGTGLGTIQNLAVGPSTARRRHAFLKLATPLVSRYWRATVTGGGGAWTAGIFALGQSLQPVYGHEWGSGRFIRDMSSVTALRGGGFGIDRGARAGGYQFTCGDLNDAEVDSLYDMVEEVGESAPVVVCRDPALTGADLNNALHYGLLDRPEAYRREAPGLNSWSFRVKDWV